MAQSLNTLVVKVMGDIKDVQAKLGKLDKRVKTTNKKINGFSKSVGAGVKKFVAYVAAIGATVMALRKVTQFLTSSIKAYNDQEIALAKLTSALKSTGRFSLETMDDMERFASTMQDTTGISDDLVNSAQAIMTTFTQISTKTFPEAINLAADMSKMFGQDLQQSVIQLGTALNDPIRGVGRLRRIGISFSEEQKKSIELFMEQNDIMGAQRVILDELQMEIGGTAKAMGETFAGQSDIMKASIVDLKEQIGELLGDALKPMLPIITETTKAWTGYLDIINEAKKAKILFQKVWEGDIELSKLETETLQQVISARELQIQSNALAIAKRTRDTSKFITEKEEMIKAIQDEMKARAQNINGLEIIAREYLEQLEILDDVKEKEEETTESLENQKDTLFEVSDAWTRYAENMRNATNENIKMIESIKKIGPILNEQQEPIRQFSRSILDGNADIIDSIDELIEAEETMADRHEKIFKEKMIDAWVELFDVSRSMSENIKEAMKALLVSFLRGLGKEFAAIAGAMLILLRFVAAARNALAASVMFAAAAAIQNLAEGGVATRATLAQIGEAGPEAVVPLSRDALKPFAQAIVGEIGKLQAPGAPNIAMGNNVFNIKIGSEPIIRVVQKGFDNKQLRANVKTIR